MIKQFLTIASLVVIGGCSSVELEKGPDISEIYYGGGNGGFGSEESRIDKLRESLIPNPRFQISDPMMPIVSAPLSFPVYMRGARTATYQEEGRWVHEIVKPGGYIN